MEDFWKSLSDSAQAAYIRAGVTFEQLKGASAEKFAELSEKAEKMAAEAKEESAETLAEMKAMREKITAHEGGALGFISDKARTLYGEAKEEAAELADEGKGFWEKAKDYVADKTDDARQFVTGKNKEEEEEQSKTA